MIYNLSTKDLANLAEKEPRPHNMEIILGPQTRDAYLKEQLRMDGLLTYVQEDPTAAYCAVSLTNTPPEAKEFVKTRQGIVKDLLANAGISAYDPGNAPLSPDLNLSAGPEEIYRTDLARVAGARFFTAFDTFPSTGVGVEMEAARRYNRFAVIFHDNHIRTSRMQPNAAIHIGVENLQEQKEEITALFTLLQEYTPGRGLQKDSPVLLGFKDDTAVDIADVVAKKFPRLVYTFDGTKPALNMSTQRVEGLF